MANIDKFILTETFGSLKEALVALNQTRVSKGQPYVLKYLTASSTVDILFAIGIKDDSGPGSYSIISEKSIIPIVSIFRNSLPDISLLYHGERYIASNKGVSGDGKNYLVYNNNGILEKKVISTPIYISCLQDHKIYYVTSTDIKDIADSYTKAEVDRKIKNHETIINSQAIKITKLESEIAELKRNVKWMLENWGSNPGTGDNEGSLPDIPEIEEPEPEQPIVNPPKISSFNVNNSAFLTGETAEVVLSWAFENPNDVETARLSYLGANGNVTIVVKGLDPELNENVSLNSCSLQLTASTTITLTAFNKNQESDSKSVDITFSAGMFIIPLGTIEVPGGFIYESEDWYDEEEPELITEDTKSGRLSTLLNSALEPEPADSLYDSDGILFENTTGMSYLPTIILPKETYDNRGVTIKDSSGFTCTWNEYGALEGQDILIDGVRFVILQNSAVSTSDVTFYFYPLKS